MITVRLPIILPVMTHWLSHVILSNLGEKTLVFHPRGGTSSLFKAVSWVDQYRGCAEASVGCGIRTWFVLRLIWIARWWGNQADSGGSEHFDSGRIFNGIDLNYK